MRRAFALLALAGAVACGRPRAPGALAPAPAPAGACELLHADSTPDTLTVGVPGSVDLTHAPVPENAAERLVFGTLYEPLIRLDCTGQAIPALAAQWVQQGPRRWRFTLRQGARFWDGTPVTSQDIAAAWAGRMSAFAASLSTPDPRTLTVELAGSDSTALRRFADPGLAVARPGVDGAPPEGTTPYRLVAWGASQIDVRPADRPTPLVRFRLAEGADPRDLLDEGADLVMTGDPDAVKYAAGRDAFDVVPLPWAWTYVLAGPWALPPTDAAALPGLRDAVRGAARLAQPPFWWTAAAACPAPDSAAVASPAQAAPTIAYVESDPVARGLADRLAALSAEGVVFVGNGALRTQGFTQGAFERALATGAASAFILALPGRGYGACRSARLASAVPLVDVRQSLIARPGRAHVVVDWGGTPRLVVP